MKKTGYLFYFLVPLSILSWPKNMFSQNIGIGTTIPAGKLHIKGSANIPQLIIDANGTQGNTNPLIKLRNSTGRDLMWIHADDSTTVFIGQYAGRVNTAGTGIWNVFIGGKVGYSNTTGNSNTAIGSSALFSNTTGHQNTAHGAYALYANTTGNFNTATGEGALQLNTTGEYNTAHGISALTDNSTGSFNSAYGAGALAQNTTGNNNTANGFFSLIISTTGNDNTASGFKSLYSNQTGDYNSAIGSTALYSNISGTNNSAVGSAALYSNTLGANNSATGYGAMYSNTTGNANTANGINALYSNNTGSENTAIGYYSFFFNSAGLHNTALGAYALYGTTNSQFNTALGFNAGAVHNMGWNNTVLGANSDINSDGFFNCIAIGQGVLCTASNQARIGNTSTNSIGGYVNWSNISDGRIKKNIQDNVPGLAFINKLKPVTYNLDLSAADRIIEKPPLKDKDGKIIPASLFETDARRQKERIIYTGFIAQDVEKAAREIGYDFSGVDAARNEKDLYGLRYAEFVVPLVKAVQEQQQQMEDMKKEMELLKEQNKMLLQLLNKKN